MARNLSGVAQGAIVLSAFFVPVLTYLYYTRSQQQKSSKDSAGTLPPPTEITALYVHPIKSCHGISVPSAKLLPTGLDLDRQWMWVSYPKHEFLTIRQNSKMTLIRPHYDSSTDTLRITAPSPDPNSGEKKLEFSIPAHPTATWLSQNTSTHPVKIWSTETPAQIYSPALTHSFNDFFEQEVRLAYKAPTSSSPRRLVSNGAPEVLGRSASTCFPDLMPLLIGSVSSLHELNTRLARAPGFEREIDITRFRPNVVVAGSQAAPWDEDCWKTLRVLPKGRHAVRSEALTWDVTQRCARCRVPNVDPDTAVQDTKQPWDVLMKYRRVDEGITFKPCFGMLCVPREGSENGTGVKIKVGDTVQVLEVTGDHRYIAGF